MRCGFGLIASDQREEGFNYGGWGGAAALVGLMVVVDRVKAAISVGWGDARVLCCCYCCVFGRGGLGVGGNGDDGWIVAGRDVFELGAAAQAVEAGVAPEVVLDEADGGDSRRLAGHVSAVFSCSGTIMRACIQ